MQNLLLSRALDSGKHRHRRSRMIGFMFPTNLHPPRLLRDSQRRSRSLRRRRRRRRCRRRTLRREACDQLQNPARVPHPLLAVSRLHHHLPLPFRSHQPIINSQSNPPPPPPLPLPSHRRNPEYHHPQSPGSRSDSELRRVRLHLHLSQSLHPSSTRGRSSHNEMSCLGNLLFPQGERNNNIVPRRRNRMGTKAEAMAARGMICWVEAMQVHLPLTTGSRCFQVDRSPCRFRSLTISSSI